MHVPTKTRQGTVWGKRTDDTPGPLEVDGCPHTERRTVDPVHAGRYIDYSPSPPVERSNRVIDNNPAGIEIFATSTDVFQLHTTGRFWRYTGPPISGWQLIDNDHEIEDAQNWLHAISISDGSERPHSPVHIEGSFGAAR